MKQEDPPMFLDLTGFPPDMKHEDKVKEARRQWQEMSQEDKWAKWEKVGIVPPATSSEQEERSPFSGLPLSELDRLGIPQPNYDLALRNMAILAKEYGRLLGSGLTREEARERLRLLTAELIDPQSRLNQATREYQALRSEGLSPEEAKEQLRDRFPELKPEPTKPSE